MNAKVTDCARAARPEWCLLRLEMLVFIETGHDRRGYTYTYTHTHVFIEMRVFINSRHAMYGTLTLDMQCMAH